MDEAKTVYLQSEDYSIIETTVFPNPANPEEYLIPQGAAETAPPKVSEHELALLKNGYWQIIPDFRGTKLYGCETKEETEIREAGKVPADFEGFTTKPPQGFCKWDNAAQDWVFDLEACRNAKLEEISFAFDNALENGSFTSSTLGIDVDCRRGSAKNDLQNVQGLISYLERSSAESTTYVGVSEAVPATPAQLKSLACEMEDHVLGLYNRKWALEAQARSAASEADLKAVVWQ